MAISALCDGKPLSKSELATAIDEHPIDEIHELINDGQVEKGSKPVSEQDLQAPVFVVLPR